MLTANYSFKVLISLETYNEKIKIIFANKLNLLIFVA